MLLIDYPSIRGEDFKEYAKQSTWGLLNSYIYIPSQGLIHEYPGGRVQAVTILQYQCSKITLSENSRYNRLFQQVVQKVGESEINYINRFENTKALVISVVNS